MEFGMSCGIKPKRKYVRNLDDPPKGKTELHNVFAILVGRK